MRINVDREVCIGAGQCVLAAPDVFDQDTKDGRVILISPDTENAVSPDTDNGDDGAIRTAVQVCPSGALTVVD